MIMRAVEIDKKFAQRFEHLDRDGRAIHELFVRAAGADASLDQQFTILTRFQTRFFEHGVDLTGVLQVKPSLDSAGVLPGADEAAVSTLTENEFESTDDDGFARAGLTRDAHETRCQLPGDILDQGEVADFEE